MIYPTASQHSTLSQIRDAGAEGVPFEGLALGDAIALALDDLVSVNRTERRVYVTAKGEAFLARVAA